jgi:hypothetical protein
MRNVVHTTTLPISTIKCRRRLITSPNQGASCLSNYPQNNRIPVNTAVLVEQRLRAITETHAVLDRVAQVNILVSI